MNRWGDESSAPMPGPTVASRVVLSIGLGILLLSVLGLLAAMILPMHFGGLLLPMFSKGIKSTPETRAMYNASTIAKATFTRATASTPLPYPSTYNTTADFLNELVAQKYLDVHPSFFGGLGVSPPPHGATHVESDYNLWRVVSGLSLDDVPESTPFVLSRHFTQDNLGELPRMDVSGLSEIGIVASMTGASHVFTRKEALNPAVWDKLYDRTTITNRILPP